MVRVLIGIAVKSAQTMATVCVGLVLADILAFFW